MAAHRDVQFVTYEFSLNKLSHHQSQCSFVDTLLRHWYKLIISFQVTATPKLSSVWFLNVTGASAKYYSGIAYVENKILDSNVLKKTVHVSAADKLSCSGSNKNDNPIRCIHFDRRLEQHIRLCASIKQDSYVATAQSKFMSRPWNNLTRSK